MPIVVFRLRLSSYFRSKHMLQGGLDMKFNPLSVCIVIFLLNLTKGKATVESKYDLAIEPTQGMV